MRYAPVYFRNSIFIPLDELKNSGTMKKIDILNFITNFRKAPNDIKTYKDIAAHVGATNEALLNQLLVELQQAKVIRETELSGEKAYQVIAR